MKLDSTVRNRTLCSVARFTLLLTALMGNRLAQTHAAQAFDDPIFNLKAIMNDPLEAKVLDGPKESDGIVVEEIEYTSQVHEGKPIRIFSILAYPPGAKRKPAVFFSMPGMAPASAYWSSAFAKKGYVCLTVTLPKGKLPPVPAVDGKVLPDRNLTNFAIAQMRGITYLTTRPEVDVERIGIGGSSYGGFFATLIAGADPRVKAGMSFFAGGYHNLGTNLPMFHGLGSIGNADLWMKTIDPAWRLTKRKVPFLWGVAVNDHWFHFPALVKTYEDSIGEKRIGLLPHWAHAFDENMDNQLLDWFDTQLARPSDNGFPKVRRAYNQAGEPSIKVENGRLVASWGWSGENPVKDAQLVVSYGPAKPWHGWVHRYHHPMPAEIAGRSAVAEIPVPEVKTPIVVYGNTIDERGVLISTLPKTVVPADLGLARPTGKPKLNCYPLGAFEEEDWTHLVRTGIQFGTPDRDVRHSGTQSVRMAAPKNPKAKHRPARMKLLNVPAHSHRLTVWLRADAGAKLEVRVQALAPSHWGRAVVEQLRQRLEKKPLPAPAKTELPVYTLDAEAGPTWKQFTIECPFNSVPVEGYNLTIQQQPETRATYWVDDVQFEPQWQE